MNANETKATSTVRADLGQPGEVDAARPTSREEALFLMAKSLVNWWFGP